MRGLLLEPSEVDHERRVILEELAMYESDPWDALERRVQALLYGDHPYGRAGAGDARRAGGDRTRRSCERSSATTTVPPTPCW